MNFVVYCSYSNTYKKGVGMKTQPVLVIILGILSISILLFSATVWNDRIKDVGGVVEGVPPTLEEQGPIK